MRSRLHTRLSSEAVWTRTPITLSGSNSRSTAFPNSLIILLDTPKELDTCFDKDRMFRGETSSPVLRNTTCSSETSWLRYLRKETQIRKSFSQNLHREASNALQRQDLFIAMRVPNICIYGLTTLLLRPWMFKAQHA